MDYTSNIFKMVFLTVGGWIGYLIAELRPTFPLILVMVGFVLYDAYSAYSLDKRVKQKYPDKKTRNEAKFTSFAFGKVVRKTIPERIAFIILAFFAEKYVFLHMEWHLEYVATGVIIFEQLISIAENMASCNDTDSRFWKLLKKILIDKTERHLDIELGELKDGKEEQPC